MNNEKIFYVVFRLYAVLYVFIYFGYILCINVLHVSYNVMSLLAVLLPFFLLLLFQWILWKCTDLRHERKVRTTFIVIVSIGFILFLYCIVILGLNEYKSNFTTEKWLNAPAERVYMVDDLLNKYELVGKTKDEVNTLLGTPTATDYSKNENNMVYYLGDERGFISIDSEWLVISLNGNEKVIKSQIRTD